MGAVRAAASSASVLLDEVPDWTALLDRHSAASLEPHGRGTRVHWENVPPAGADERECALREGALAALLADAAGRAPEVLHVACRARGDARCLFEVAGVRPVPDPTHAALLRESALLCASLQTREGLARRLRAISARIDPFPDIQELRAMRRFMEEVEDGILIFDHELRVIDANRAGTRIHGMSLDELRGLSVRDLLEPEDFRIVQERLPLLRRVRSLRGLQVRARRRDGSSVAIEVSARVSDNGETIVCIARDVGEPLRLKQELEVRNRLLAEQYDRIREAGRLKSEFLANVSHELTTPITCVRGFTRLLLGELVMERRQEPPRLPLEKRIEFLEIVQREANRMGDLIKGLLELSKIESGVVTLDRLRLSLNDVVEESLRVLQPRLDEAELRVLRKLDASLPDLYLDPDRIKQVLLNLVENAAKFSQPGSTVTVRTTRAASGVRLGVRNPSGELRREDLERVFDRFVQRDGSFTRRQGGVGLGLNLVRAIVELHGGRVWADIDAGQVEFVAELPLHP